MAERTSYRPYGEEVAILQPLTLPETKGFIGERFNDQSGRQYLNARYYDPKLGMFVQPDWWEVMQPGVGSNRYSYSFGDPVNGKDPSGNDLATAQGYRKFHGGISVGVAPWGGGQGVFGGSGALPSPATIRAIETALGSLFGPENVVSNTLEMAAGIGHNNGLGGTIEPGELQTPGGAIIGNHGGKGTAGDYIGGKGHTPESIDDILNDPAHEYPGQFGDNATGGKQGTRVVVGKNGDWAVVNDETGKVIQVNDRYNKKQGLPEEKGESEKNDKKKGKRSNKDKRSNQGNDNSNKGSDR